MHFLLGCLDTYGMRINVIKNILFEMYIWNKNKTKTEWNTTDSNNNVYHIWKQHTAA